MTWFLVSLSFVSFIVVNWAFLPKRDTVFWSIPFIGSWSFGIILFVFATLAEHPLPSNLNPNHSHYCDFCQDEVPMNAKHCRRCNRCLCGFDHHCRFINNCVTQSNYTAFFWGCLLLLTAWYIGIVHLIWSAFAFRADSDSVISRMTSRFRIQTSKSAFWILFGVGMLINLGISIPMTFLVGYHTFFQRIGVTTWDYLLRHFQNAPQELPHFCCSCSGSARVEAS
jgi:hypothetical protein